METKIKLKSCKFRNEIIAAEKLSDLSPEIIATILEDFQSELLRTGRIVEIMAVGDDGTDGPQMAKVMKLSLNFD